MSVEPSATDLLDTLRSCLPVLPVLVAQLQEVVHHVEEAVVGVCGNFQDMAARARQLAKQEPLSKGPSDDGRNANADGVDGLISSTRQTMGMLLQRVEQTSSFSTRAVQRMETIEERMGDLDKMLREMDSVATQARLLALNGQIEAARLGTQGAAFDIVATETAKMADKAMTSSKTIRKTTQMVATNINGTSKELRERAVADTRDATLSRDEVDQTLDAMTALHTQMQQTIQQSKLDSDQLARDISSAVMAMQFQDAVSQRISHVVHSLEEMARILQSRLAESGVDASSSAAAEWAHRMAAEYTMASEHEVLAAHVGGGTNGAQDLGNDIELF